jgi:hypothetical protein
LNVVLVVIMLPSIFSRPRQVELPTFIGLTNFLRRNPNISVHEDFGGIAANGAHFVRMTL